MKMITERLKKIILKILKVLLLLFISLTGILLTLFIFFYITFPKEVFEKDYSKVILDENGEILRVFLNKKEQWHFPPVKEEKVPEKLIKTVTFFEDRHFYKHNGVNFKSIFRALKQNIFSMKKVSGASTITMQTARLMKPKKRSIKNKIIEIFQAFVIETKYSKKEILELYFNHAPYGGNIVGYKTASLKYFNKKPQHLTWAESALLAILPNAPGMMHPGKNKDSLKKKRDRLLKRMNENGIISDSDLNLAVKEPLPSKIYDFDFTAPHFSLKVKEETNEFMINTTISKPIQLTAEKTAKEYIESLKEEGINNASIIIADTKTREIKAYVGSNDFWDDKNCGNVDGIIAKRSPGSTLKPFLYGLAIDNGILLPDSLIKDVPVYYGTFSPYNADRKFRGMVTAEFALINSLNVPAVNILDEYGLYNFFEFIKQSGTEISKENPMYYGYSIILGSMEMSLYEITSMYTSLGNYGKFAPLKELKSDTGIKEEKQLISKGASYLVLDMLKDLKRPGSDYFWKEFSSKRYIAWKTGTSFGRRDGWAVGVTPEYTIGVWVGNFDGKSSYSITGIESAGTLLFKIFSKINTKNEWFQFPEKNLKKIITDKKTGYFPGFEEIDETIERDSPKNAKPLKKSPYYKVIYTDKDEEYEVCSLCWDSNTKKKKVMLIYPPDVVSYYEKQGIKTYSPLPHNKECKSVKNGDEFKLIYPKNNSVIVIPRGLNGEYQKLTVKTSLVNGKLYWFIDENFYMETLNQGELNMDIENGNHTITVMNENGSKKQIELKIVKK